MTHDDVLFGQRLRLFTLAEELGNVSEACRLMGFHRSTYYRLKANVDRWGLEALRVRERRRPRMLNEIGPHLEQRVIAFALAHPGFGPRRISAELRRPKWGGIKISEHGVWRVLRRVGLNTRSKRLALIARHRDPHERRPVIAPKELHIDASRPGGKVQMDCFYIGPNLPAQPLRTKALRSSSHPVCRCRSRLRTPGCNPDRRSVRVRKDPPGTASAVERSLLPDPHPVNLSTQFVDS
jgi:transposase